MDNFSTGSDICTNFVFSLTRTDLMYILGVTFIGREIQIPLLFFFNLYHQLSHNGRLEHCSNEDIRTGFSEPNTYLYISKSNEITTLVFLVSNRCCIASSNVCAATCKRSELMVGQRNVSSMFLGMCADGSHVDSCLW